MKKIISKLVLMFSVVTAILFAPNINTANAATPIVGSNIWHDTTTDQLINFYDINNSGSVNILDLVIAKQHVLDSTNGAVSIYDVLNLQHYLNTGKTLFDINYVEWDLHEITFESDAIIKEAAAGILIEWAYTRNALCARFLNNRTITELRFYNYEDITSYMCEPLVETPYFTICKDDSTLNHCYFIDNKFLVENATYSKCISIDDQIKEYNILSIINDTSTHEATFFMNRTDHIEALTMPIEMDAHNMHFTKICDLDFKFSSTIYLLGKKIDTSEPCVYNNTFCYSDYNYLITKAQTYDEFVEKYKSILSSLDGELLQYNTVNQPALFIYCKENEDHFDYLQVIEIDPKKRGDADYIVKEWEKDGEKFVLGVSDNKFIWDSSSNFSVG